MGSGQLAVTTCCAALCLIVGCTRSRRANSDASPGAADARSTPSHAVLVFVWDGLRPDDVTVSDTPRLARLGTEGVRFADHHATYPTFTMMNAASFATGAYPSAHAFFGNRIYVADAVVRPSEDDFGSLVVWSGPVFTEDASILRQLEAHYREKTSHGVLLTDTLFHVAHAHGLHTAAVGKVGPVDLMDLAHEGLVVEEHGVWPAEAAREIQRRFGLPPTALQRLDSGAHQSVDAGRSFVERDKVYLSDGVTPDPEDDGGTPFRATNDWIVQVTLDYVLPVEKPDLCVLWLRNPDSTDHVYGPGTANARDALRVLDGYLGRIEAKLAELDVAHSTDLVVVSDHGHSTVSGPLSLFPLRPATNTRPREVDRARIEGAAFSVSGDVRLADRMRGARPAFEAYDGLSCVRDPVLSGIDRNGRNVYPGASCTTPGYPVPEEQGHLSNDAVIVASNGGTDYLYVPSHDPQLMARAVRFLQSRPEIGPIFLSRAARSDGEDPLPGTMPLDAIRLQDGAQRAPDIVVSYAWDDRAIVSGAHGIEFAGCQSNVLRGMHGSFSPVDVHNVLLARGPSFQRGWVDARPSGNVDVASTVAHLLGLELPRAQGRCLAEALVDGCGGQAVAERATRKVIGPKEPASNLAVGSPTSPRSDVIAARGRRFGFELVTQELTQAGETYVYFDQAGAWRR